MIQGNTVIGYGWCKISHCRKLINELKRISNGQVNSNNQTNFNHSHKKWKDSLETRAERVILRASVEKHAILEPILLYRASKYKQMKRPGYERSAPTKH